MKRILHFRAILIFITVLSFASCNKKGVKCDVPYNVNQSEIVVVFKEQATGRYLYYEFHPLYNKDSLKVLDENGKSLVLLSALNLIPNTSSRYWDISFGSLYDPTMDARSFDAEICKLYTIKYRYNESDTLKVCYKSKEARCNGSVFETLKVYHHGQLIGSITDNTGLVVTLNKN
jgi:hypothetical protein